MYLRSKACKCRPMLLVLNFVLLCFICTSASANQTIHVFYPEVREPYNSIFNEIISGIEAASAYKVSPHAVRSNEDLENYDSLFDEAIPGSTIVLGNVGKALAATLAKPFPLVSGAVLLTDSDINAGITGISLSPSPTKLFDMLQTLAPNVKIVSVVYHKETNGWLVDIAADYAKTLGITLERFEATDVREAAAEFKTVFENHQGSSHAIWLLQGDPTLDEKGLLPDVLTQAWKSGCVVFSSNPAHVKRGALFSLFPDNYAMGKSLADMADHLIKGNVAKPEPVSDLKIAVNVRTAEHLNLNISRSQERGFDLVFPSQ